MKHRLPRAMVALALGWGPASPALAVDRMESVDLAPGRAVLSGEVSGDDTASYTFSAGVREAFSARFRPDHPNCYFSILPSESDDVIHDGSMDGHDFDGKLASGGLYQATVYLLGPAAERGETCRYSLEMGFGD